MFILKYPSKANTNKEYFDISHKAHQARRLGEAWTNARALAATTSPPQDPRPSRVAP